MLNDMRKKLTIEEMQEIAKKRGGECLSKVYVNAKTKLRWRCEKGHEWEACPSDVKHDNTWCPYCVGKNKTIEDMKKIAKARGGFCLSETYINNRVKLKWQCEEGHIWEAGAANVINGTWCPVCSYKKRGDLYRLSIKEMQRMAEEKGGKCLSKKYVNSSTKLKWECSEGHIWVTAPYNIRNGNWCPYCAGLAKLTIEEMRDIAADRGGLCISNEYVNLSTKLTWQCENGHIWDATPRNIKNGKWCPTCSSGRDERIVRVVFEKLFGQPFPRKHPKWLINPETGHRLELDGYDQELGIAFEYQGPQHYIHFEDYFHKKRGLEKQKKMDELKRELCKKNNVKLIEVPYYTKREDYPNHIIEQCEEKGITIDIIPLDIYDYRTFEGVFTPSHLEEMHGIAKKKGGDCLSSIYVDDNTKLNWKCKKGHTWAADPNHIRRGQWCPVCRYDTISKKLRGSIEDMQSIARERGGKCLSQEYINSQTKLTWQCKEGHVWEAVSGSIKQGTWCPTCAGKKKLTIEDMIKIAKERCGFCLSREYINNKTKLKWKCKEGHIWMAIPKEIKRGSWCPICARNKKRKRLP